MDLPRLRTVKGVKFEVLDPNDIRNYAVVQVTSTWINNKPVPNGLSDPRMGPPRDTLNTGIRCTTCSLNSEHCPGHFGYIQLAKTMFHPYYLPTVVLILRCICYGCKRLLFCDPTICSCDPLCITANTEETEEDAPVGNARLQYILKNFNGKKRLSELASKLSKVNVCFHQDCYQEKKRVTLSCFQPYPENFEYTAEKIYGYLQRIPFSILGFSADFKPEGLVLTVLPIPPPSVRPAAIINGTIVENDLTVALKHIVTANEDLKSHERNGEPDHILEEYAKKLQLCISQYFNNEYYDLVQSSGRPVESLHERLKGKQGRIRGNLMGKRTNFSARSVITGDPNIGLDEIGIPLSVAHNLTFPEIVSPYNIKRLAELVANDPTEYPSAKYIIRPDGVRYDNQILKGKVPLDFGFIVERSLQDGDYIAVNRQPSMHKQSLMGHKARILPYSTFRLNISATSPYNADFDGDEMNLFVPQSLEAKVEIQELAQLPKQIVSPLASAPVVGIVQDTLLGAHLLTHRSTFINKVTLQNLMMWIDNEFAIPPPAILKPQQLWTGKQVFSLLLPSTLYYTNQQSSLPCLTFSTSEHPLASDTTVTIKKGEIMVGNLCKKSLGPVAGGLVHVIWNDYGPQATTKFINETQFLINNWLMDHSFSIGISDLIVNDTTRAALISTIKNTPSTESSTKFRDKLLINLDYKNAIKCMLTADSKGTISNAIQSVVWLGDQFISGEHIPAGFKSNRTLPHFMPEKHIPADVNDLTHSGFIARSFCTGVTAAQYFFHAMTGWDSMINSHFTTKDTGYLQRKLTKTLERVKIEYDGTVHSSLGIVQFVYGEDGLDPSKLEKVDLHLHLISPEEFLERYHMNIDTNFDIVHNDYKTLKILAQEEYQLWQDRNYLQTHLKTYPNHNWFSFCNIQHIIENAKLNSTNNMELHPIDIISNVKVLLQFINNAIFSFNELELFKIYIRSFLASKRILIEFKLNSETFQQILMEIYQKFQAAIIQPGEMVGCIAAQSMIGPLTQINLNAIHFTGSKVVSNIKALQQICCLTQKSNTSSMKIILKDPSENNCTKIIPIIKVTSLLDITQEISYQIETNEDESQFYWNLYYKLDETKLKQLNLNCDEISKRIKDCNKIINLLKTCDIKCAANTICFQQLEFTDGMFETIYKKFIPKLNDIVICGVAGVTDVIAHPKTNLIVKNDKSVSQKECILQTKGSNLKGLLTLQNLKYIDAKYTTSNNIDEIFQVFGIEAARAVILEELHRIFEASKLVINNHHILLIADFMTHRGTVRPFTIHGVKREPGSPLYFSSFEDQVSPFYTAAEFNQTDYLKGVSESIFLGKLAPVGTGCFDIFFDEQMVERESKELASFSPSLTPEPSPLQLPSSPHASENSPVDQENYPSTTNLLLPQNTLPSYTPQKILSLSASSSYIPQKITSPLTPAYTPSLLLPATPASRAYSPSQSLFTPISSPTPKQIDYISPFSPPSSSLHLSPPFSPVVPLSEIFDDTSSSSSSSAASSPPSSAPPSPSSSPPLPFTEEDDNNNNL